MTRNIKNSKIQTIEKDNAMVPNLETQQEYTIQSVEISTSEEVTFASRIAFGALNIMWLLVGQ